MTGYLLSGSCLLLALLVLAACAGATEPATADTPVPGTPEGASAVTAETPPSYDGAFPTAAIDAQIAVAGGAWRMIVVDADTGEVLYARDAEMVVPAPDLAPLPICVAAYHLAHTGALTMGEPALAATEATNNVLPAQPAQPTASLRDWCERALVDGDRAAAWTLASGIGSEQLTAALQDLGVHNTTVADDMLTTTVSDYARVVTVVATGAGLPADASPVLFGSSAHHHDHDDHDHAGTDVSPAPTTSSSPSLQAFAGPYAAWSVDATSARGMQAAALLQASLGGQRLVLVVDAEQSGSEPAVVAIGAHVAAWLAAR